MQLRIVGCTTLCCVAPASQCCCPACASHLKPDALIPLHCSACRAVCYCSPTCCRTNWRAGHKHVCGRLGEARAAAKAARQQAAEAEWDALDAEQVGLQILEAAETA